MKRSLILLLAAIAAIPMVVAQPPPPAAPDDAPSQRDRPRLDEEQAAEVEERANAAWERMPLREKLQVLRLHRGLRQMEPYEREIIRERVDRYLRMTPEERRQFKANRERWQHLSPEQKERARQELRRRVEEFKRRWREEHPGEEPPPFVPHRPRSHGPPSPEEDASPPAETQPPIQE